MNVSFKLKLVTETVFSIASALLFVALLILAVRSNSIEASQIPGGKTIAILSVVCSVLHLAVRFITLKKTDDCYDEISDEWRSEVTILAVATGVLSLALLLASDALSLLF